MNSNIITKISLENLAYFKQSLLKIKTITKQLIKILQLNKKFKYKRHPL